MNRSRLVLGLILAAAIASLGLVSSAAAASRYHPVWRWDIVGLDAPNNLVFPGATAMSKDAATGDTIAVTGSGHFAAKRRRASGAGTFEHKQADGTLVGKGTYVVTGFRSFRNDVGKPPPFVFAIASGLGQPRPGILTLAIRTLPEAAGVGPFNATLTVYCHFEGSRIVREDQEGVGLRVLNYNFAPIPEQGGTVFHRFRR